MKIITINRAVVEQALEALEAMQAYAAAERKGLRICDEAITALKAALAEPVQEPVAFCYLRQTSSDRNPPHGWAVFFSKREGDVPLYTNPPRQWQGLTDEERDSFWKADQMTSKEWDELFNAIEAKLREKNNG